VSSRHYARAVLRVRTLNELQYRANFAMSLFRTVIGLGSGLAMILLVYHNTTTLSGWSRPELLVVLGVYQLLFGLAGAIVEPSLGRLMEEVEKGTLDFILLKPVDAQLAVSVWNFQPWRLIECVSGLGTVVWGLLEVGPTVGEVLKLAVLLVVGFAVVYSFWIALTCTAFWFVQVDEIVRFVIEGASQAGRWPVAIYPGWMRVVFTAVVPIGIAVTVPVEALTGRLSPVGFAASLGFGVALVLGARALFRAGVRRYAGASA